MHFVNLIKWSCFFSKVKVKENIKKDENNKEIVKFMRNVSLNIFLSLLYIFQFKQINY